MLKPQFYSSLSGKNDQLTPHFVLGADKILENPDLYLNADGEGELYNLHEMVVKGLPKLVNGKNLTQRWIDREKLNNYKYFAFYQKNLNNQIVAIITGTITDDNLRIINTATQDKNRRSGVMENCIYKLINDDNLKHINHIESTLNTGINELSQFASMPVMDKFKELYLKILDLINSEIEKHSLLKVLDKDHEITIEKATDEQKVLLFHANRFMKIIRASDLWEEKINTKLLFKIVRSFESSSADFDLKNEIKFRFEIGNPTNNINLIPYSSNMKKLREFANKKIMERKSHNILH